ncbi:MAG: hypothetical protein AUJ55_03050 [Proteobacteria bacterium CG1_02_64_396]|nr:MAG: hypothetical protein AUJ55_03050 [Proteobacteria bacterium CG1_02_64_396]
MSPSGAFERRFEIGNIEHCRQLCGEHDRHLARIEEAFGVTIHAVGNRLTLIGSDASMVDGAVHTLEKLLRWLQEGREIEIEAVDDALRFIGGEALPPMEDGEAVLRTRKRKVTPRSPRQEGYIRALKSATVTFGLGPAGTGKTYIAMAAAVHHLLARQVDRIILTRPAVEAGERLGFLPGSLQEKVDPYLRPLFDALYDMLEPERVEKLTERGVIEVAPLAFMRGRTLNNAYIILDEAQNTTPEQMKMFLTRIGYASRAAVTGDPSQVDLPKGQPSGLVHAVAALEGVEGVNMCPFDHRDVVRHPIIERIIQAYDRFEQQGGRS